MIADNLSQLFGEQEQLQIVAEDAYEQLWRAYFRTMAITERRNEDCQNTLLPKWYRKNMLEFE